MSARERLLLLTGTPPGSGNVGEIILRDLGLHYGPQHIHCAAVVGPRYSHVEVSQLAAMNLHVHRTPHVAARRRGDTALAAAISDLRFPFGFRAEAKALVAKIVQDARASGVQLIFAVLNNALMMTLAHRVADRLGLPMVTLVWDPPDYVLRQSGFARYARRRLLVEFDRSLARSRRVGVVSDHMRAAYAARTAAPIQLLRHGRAQPVAIKPPASPGEDKSEWTIGFAGSMYADCAWAALLRALDGVGWRIADRPVRLRVMTAKLTLESRAGACIEFLGFRADDEIDALLAECDLNYLPQPFKPHLRELCQLAFPTKLAAYLGTGKPVFVHCPDDSALGDYFDAHPFGAICRSLEASAIIASIEALLGDSQRYRHDCETSASLAQTQFGLPAFYAAVDAMFASPTA